jgi:anion-transporting  ArsA/GET3 family ATPase
VDPEQFFAASRLVIVAGKGGVGKTTVSATLARAAALTGLSTLIVEVEGKSGLPAVFGQGELGYDEVVLAAGGGPDGAADVRARTLTADAALVEYLRDHGLSRISRRLVSSGALDVVATAAPGIKDILVLGKVKQLERAGIADLIVLDAPAAGHAVQFLMSARGLQDAVKVGPVQKQATDVVELLADPTRCQVMLVTLPEETPVNELVDTAFAIEDRAGVALGPIVVNACLPEVDGLSADRAQGGIAAVRADAASAGITLDDSEAAALAAAASFRIDARARQQEQRARLATLLPLPQIELPFLFTADVGPAEVDILADAFAAGVEAMDPVTR